MSAVEEVRIKDAESFIEYLRPTNKVWGSGPSFHWLFRGQADANWKVLPRAWRPPTTTGLAPLVAQMDDYIRNERSVEFAKYSRSLRLVGPQVDLVRQIVSECAAEQDAVNNFIVFSGEIGMPLSKSAKVQSGTVFIDKVLDGSTVPDIIASSEFGIAQHHGIPTRLMDFSRKPLIGAFFASQLPEKSAGISEIAVWALNLEYLRNMDPTYGVRTISHARAQDPYLRAQDGLFVTVDKAGPAKLNSGTWPDLISIFDDSYKSGPRPWRKITLPITEVDDLELLLWRERISLAHLMPNYDNVARLAIAQWAKHKKIRISVSAYGDDDD